MGCSYRDLIAWQKAVQFVTAVYRVTASFPREELYGLVSQLRRAAVSIASNIAEGQGRLTEGEFRQFLGHARGSCFEVETQLHIARDLGYLSNEQLGTMVHLSTDVAKLVNALISSDLSRAPKHYGDRN
jgi:four helix bundle protein